jgi:release factor glutamine methyltransferase
MKIKDFIKETNGSYILEKVLNKDKTWLFLNDELEVPKEAIEILDKVKSGYPIEYLFEEVYFYGDKFYIKEGVLIPRDDTEVVVEKAINIVNKFQVPGTKLRVVDCCTGSGVIAIEIAKHTNAKVIATDISDKALEVAKENVKLYFLNVEIKKCDLFDFSGDILVSNPPYVENSWQKPNIYEPDIAFFGGDDGLDIVKEIILRAKNLGYKAAVIEIGYNQKESLSDFLTKKVKKFDFFNDLAGNVRGVEIIF